jgi:hypothetical protein
MCTQVAVRYKGKLASNGKVFDETKGQKTFKFRLGARLCPRALLQSGPVHRLLLYILLRVFSWSCAELGQYRPDVLLWAGQGMGVCAGPTRLSYAGVMPPDCSARGICHLAKTEGLVY